VGDGDESFDGVDVDAGLYEVGVAAGWADERLGREWDDRRRRGMRRLR
jgi:hypothetical protein